MTNANNEEIQRLIMSIKSAVEQTEMQPLSTFVSLVLDEDDYNEVAMTYPSAVSKEGDFVILSNNGGLTVTFIKGA